jgi:hypothetical protein
MLCNRRDAHIAAPVIILMVLAIVLASACTDAGQSAKPAAPAATPAPAAQPAPPASSGPAPAPAASASNDQTDQPQSPAAPLQIILIHYRGSLQPLGCCDQGLYERDEFVAIKNTSKTTQDISGWKLVNITKSYPTFTFPAYFPCMPFTPSTETQYTANTGNYVSNAPRTVEQVFAAGKAPPQQKQPSINPSVINWADCMPVAPLDETPMSLRNGQQQGQPVPCLLYPGQIVLVFTDEIHCAYGGLSFRYGQGNIWDNDTPDTAVLYNPQGEEVSRKSYTVGR